MTTATKRRRARPFTETEIRQALARNASGVPARDLCESMGITRSRFYTWRERYAGAVSPNALLRWPRARADERASG